MFDCKIANHNPILPYFPLIYVITTPHKPCINSAYIHKTSHYLLPNPLLLKTLYPLTLPQLPITSE